ncbi:hypothetical protein NPIL_108261 [Nephila pilipes]|uniref:Uncharacterized protein n=1 Tax=Nephila pilipes TaxID=299642 RepID=A0A8X6T6F5_NEPPI|nr:hypothetical protein NPIL_108261 [Nephila pilipes]
MKYNTKYNQQKLRTQDPANKSNSDMSWPSNLANWRPGDWLIILDLTAGPWSNVLPIDALSRCWKNTRRDSTGLLARSDFECVEEAVMESRNNDIILRS